MAAARACVPAASARPLARRAGSGAGYALPARLADESIKPTNGCRDRGAWSLFEAGGGLPALYGRDPSWRGSSTAAGRGSWSITSLTRRDRSSSSMRASLDAKVLSASGVGRGMPPAERIAGSRSRTRTRRPCGGKRKNTGADDMPGQNRGILALMDSARTRMAHGPSSR